MESESRFALRDVRLRGVGVEESTLTPGFAGVGVGVDSFFQESESAGTRQISGNPPNWAGTRQNFDEVGGKPLIFVKKTIQVSIKDIAICPRNVESVTF